MHQVDRGGESEPVGDLGTDSARAFYFGSGGRTLFAWLHSPSSPSHGNFGVVICNPFGYESICAHRGVRRFAEVIAAEGIWVLRFDYTSTGDSSDVAEASDLLPLWIEDILAATEELKSRAGVTCVCLLGIRLGALLATLAAEKLESLNSLLLIGPVISGRKFVQELRTTRLAGVAPAGAGRDVETEEAAGGVEAGGFFLSSATLSSLVSVDLSSRNPPVARSMLIIDHDKLPVSRRWMESLADTPLEIEYQTLPGMIEMVLTAPQDGAPAEAMILASRQWLRKQSQATAFARTPSGPVKAEISSPVLHLQDPRYPEMPIVERPIWIDAVAPLFGVLSEPPHDEKRRAAVILLNAGADFHIGASRMYVSLARRWARSGYYVLRLDLAGIGDSATRPGNRDDEVFPQEAIDDVRAAIEFLRSRYAINQISLAGLCSGAYHALRAAAVGVEINRILMVNPKNYFWKKGMTLQQLQMAQVVHNPTLYPRRLLSLQAWRRVLTGQVNLLRIGAVYLQRARLTGESTFRDLARHLHIRLPEDLGWELERIAAHGIRMILLFAPGEPGIALLRLQAGSVVARLKNQCRVLIVGSGDHIFSRRGPRSVMENVLSQELFSGVESSAARGESPRPASVRRQRALPP